MSQTKFINLEERARTAISLGESHFREFKSALHGSPNKKVARDSRSICKDIGEALVAFANADGGELLVGALIRAAASTPTLGRSIVGQVR